MTTQGLDDDETTANSRRRSAFSGLEQRVLRRLQRIDAGRRPKVVVGFSGGPDSLCLAAILARLNRSDHIDPLLVHVDHRLRPESGRDAEQAGALAAELGLPIRILTIEEGPRAKHPGVGVEEAARRERYLLLADAAAAFDCGTIAVAHHQNDQVETVLMHLLRGSGLAGVAGMAEISPIRVPWWTTESPVRAELVLWRPLLNEAKAEIDAFVRMLGLQPLFDESNTDQAFRRNAIRHRVLPAIDAIFPAGREAIARFADVAREEDDLLDGLAGDALERALESNLALNRSRLLAEEAALQRRIIARWLGRWVTQTAISQDRIDAVIDLAERNHGGSTIEIGEQISIQLRSGLLVASSAEDARS